MHLTEPMHNYFIETQGGYISLLEIDQISIMKLFLEHKQFLLGHFIAIETFNLCNTVSDFFVYNP